MLPLSPGVAARLNATLLSASPRFLPPATAWASHIPFAFWLVENLRPARLVELGVYAGASYCAFCQAVSELGISCETFGVDTWGGDSQTGFYGEQVLQGLQSHHDAHYGTFSHLIRKSFDEARPDFAAGSIDLLHIDGLHTYEAVAHDFATWKDTLTDRGVILFHDITVHGGDFGVWKLWDELSAQYPSFTFRHGHGLGVLAVGANLPPAIRWLVDPTQRPDIPDDQIRAFFQFLGTALDARCGYERNAADLQHERGHVAELRRHIDEQSRQLQEQSRQMQAQERRHADEITAADARRRNDVATMEGQVAAMASTVRELQTRIASIEASTSWKITAPLRAAVTALRERRASLRGLARPAAAPAANGVPAKAPIPALKASYPERDRWYDADAPDVSVIVLNFNKANLSVACVDSLWTHTTGRRYEIVLVDNGSEITDFLDMGKLGSHARIIRLSTNRFFGEGNNIGFEASRGRYVVFMNNDVTVTPGWLEPLIDRLERDPSVGGVGPKMIYPDGRLQEAGALVDAGGSVTQLGKGRSPDEAEFNRERTVDYVSAATFAMRREQFEKILGFDLAWEPAYYEDVDLCLKVRQLGLSILFCPSSAVIHHENATAKDYFKKMSFHSIVDLNRRKFTARWAAFLAGSGEGGPKLFAEAFPSPPAAKGGRRAILYTPYNLIPGGGERYLLTIAQHLSARYEVTVATPETYSRIRLLTLGRDLCLDLDRIRVARYDAAVAEGGYELGIVLGNHLFPPVAGPARRNIYICQFPFPADEQQLKDWQRNLPGFDEVFVYSEFARRNLVAVAARFGGAYPGIRIVTPPVNLPPRPSRQDLAGKKPIVLGVGRFFAGGHAKRHDLMIDAFRDLLQAVGQPMELHLAGSVLPEPQHRDYFQMLTERAKDLPVVFHANASPQQLDLLYQSALVYWHCGGFEVDESKHPEQCEHFGISVVEAMGAGCIPLVVDRGGPVDIVASGKTGFHYRTKAQLVERSKDIFVERDKPWIAEMQEAAVVAAIQYDECHFQATLDEALGIQPAAAEKLAASV